MNIPNYEQARRAINEAVSILAQLKGKDPCPIAEAAEEIQSWAEVMAEAQAMQQPDS